MSSLNTWLRPTCWSAIVTSSWKVSLRRKIICSVSSMTVPHDSVVFPRGKPHSPALWENILVLVYKNVVVWNCLANFIVIGGHFSGMGGYRKSSFFSLGEGMLTTCVPLTSDFFFFPEQEFYRPIWPPTGAAIQLLAENWATPCRFLLSLLYPPMS